jgi:long-subunit acyl-CoA synthetase (AMP-forming)
MNNLAQLIFNKNKNNRNKTVFTDPYESVTYGEIEARARRIAAWLLLKGVNQYHCYLSRHYTSWCGSGNDQSSQ